VRLALQRPWSWRATLGLSHLLPRRRRTEDLGWLTLAEASKKYGVPHMTLKGAVQRGRLPARKVSNIYLVRPGDLEAYVRELRPRPTRRKQA
jgi:excisionase family DNA binding protein